MSDTPWLDGAVSVDGRPKEDDLPRIQSAEQITGESPWLAGAVRVSISEGFRKDNAEYAKQRLVRRAAGKEFDPSVSTGEYLGNEALKTGGSILGFVPDAVEWLGKKALGVPTDFGNVTRKIQKSFGANPDLKAPSQAIEDVGTLQSNVIGSLPFAGGAVTAGRGVLGIGTELLSGLGGGVGEIVGKQAEGVLPGIVGNVVGSALGYRAGNVVERLVPVGRDVLGLVGITTKEQKDAVRATGLKEGTPEFAVALSVEGIRAREAAVLKAKGLTESTPEFQKLIEKRMEVARRETVGDLRKSFAQEDIAAIERAFDEYERVQARFPGFKASVGEITGNEPALALQARLESKNIPALEDRGARIRGNLMATLAARGELIPQGTGGVKSVMRGVKDTLDDELRVLGEKVKADEIRLQALSDESSAFAMPVAEAGTVIKEASKEGYAKSKWVADQKYQAFRGAVGEDAPADVSGVTAKLAELQARFTFDKQPQVLGLIPAQAADGMTVAQLDDLASAANRDISMLSAQRNPDRKAIAQLQAIKTEARNTIEMTMQQRGNTEALDLYREANRYFGEEHAPKYLTGVNMEIRLRNAINEERVKPERVVDAYYKPNGTTEAKRFNEQFADNGAAKESLARGVFDLYKREVIDKSGQVIDPKRHEAFMRKYAAANEQYPWIAKRLEKNNVAAEVATRMEERRAMMGGIAESKLAQAVGTKDPEAFLQQTLSSKRELFNTITKLDPEDKKNLAIAVLNRGWDEGEKGSTAIGKFLDDNDSLRLLLRTAFGKEKADKHMDNLTLFAKGLAINERAPKTSPMAAISEDTMKGATGTSGTQIFAALRAIGRRPGSEGWFLGVFGGQFVKAKIEASKDALLKQQLFDPDLLMATIQSSRMNDTAQSAYLRSGLGKAAMSKVWDLTKAAVGQGAPTAAAIRVPAADRETEP